MDVTHNVTDTLSFDDKVYCVYPGTWQLDLSCSDDRRLAIDKQMSCIYLGWGFRRYRDFSPRLPLS